jgi:hypothetical protein
MKGLLALAVVAALALGGGHAARGAHTGSGVKAYAASLVSAGQMSCLDALWTQESGWDPSAVNPSSGAYGIPQANPAYTGGEWGAYSASDPNAQVRWGLAYIQQRYGSPCAAEQHERADGWY